MIWYLVILIVHHLFVQLERMECRAKSAEEESALLNEQLEKLKRRLDEVTFSLSYLCIVCKLIEVF